MKNLFLFFLIVSINLAAQDDERYTTAMKKNFTLLDTASTSASYNLIANSFERIANAEKDKWLPYYYSAYLITVSTFMDTISENKDAFLDKAEELLSIADSLMPENSEIYTVKAMIAQGRLIVDPQNRWMKYGPLFNDFINKAKELDPSNPRPVFLYAQNILYTPEQFGGGKEKALPHLKEAEEKFKNFEPDTELHPDWGEEVVKNTLESLKGIN
ncbi:MAG: hypothetical protein EHM47_05490 [Ignavibacteriales bacterium]|nr:MAG: hypothetical protein EHM47_05490 [Ignavibacteriales bacterium]